jgi:Ca2+:H+ antiporter
VPNRMSLYHRLVPPALGNAHGAATAPRGSVAGSAAPSLRRKPSNLTSSVAGSRSVTPTPTVRAREPSVSFEDEREPPALGKRPSYAPLLESVDTVMKDAGVRPPAELPGQMSAEAFTRAVAVATVSALRHQQAVAHSPARPRVTSGAVHEVDDGGAHGGHDAPSWSRAVSASVLLGCTFLYAIIAGTHMSDHA